MSETTPLEVTKINHHHGRNKQRTSVQAESTVQGYSQPELNVPSFHEVDDEPVRTEYASGKDELKAIYLAKTGERFRVADLDAIETLLNGRGITWETFAIEARKHAWNRIENPVGFLKSLAKRFGAKLPSSPPLTAAEVDLRDYRCSACGSTKRGEGMRLVDRKPVPCSCASPEYIARHRVSGIFTQEEASA